MAKLGVKQKYVVKRYWNGGEAVVGVFEKKVEAVKFAKAEQEVVNCYVKEQVNKFVVEKEVV